MEFSIDIDIDRSPDEVFAFVTDPSKLHLWQDVVEIEQLTPGPVGEGTRFREVHKVMGRRNEEVTEFSTFEPGRRLVVKIVEGPVPVDGAWDFEPADGGGTHLVFTASGELPGALRLLSPIAVPLTKRNFVRYHRKLKQAVESLPAPQPS